MEPVKLGRILNGSEQRDAVHVAIAPMVAPHSLEPGEFIGLRDDGTAGIVDDPIGVVDPFLTTRVQKGERFYMLLFPGTITSLRHEWTHPEFEAAEPKMMFQDTSSGTPSSTLESLGKAIREADWSTRREMAPILADAFESAGCTDNSILKPLRSDRSSHWLIQRAACIAIGGEFRASVDWLDEFASDINQTYAGLMAAGCEYDEHGEWTYDNSEEYKNHWRKFPEFWRHYRIVTGTPAKEDEDCPFTCSC